MTGSNGMSATVLSWAEITAWQTCTGVKLTPWETRIIRGLSLAYLAQSRLSESETCPPPWRGEVTQAEKDTEVAILDAVLG